MEKLFNNADLYPTPSHIIQMMCEGLNLQGKTVFDPGAGTGNIITYCTNQGAEAIYCETSETLQKILSGKGRFLKADFLEVTSDEVSHVDYIIMNPPFSADEKHILHAYNIAPAGCKIISLCNANTLKNTYTRARQELKTIVDEHGQIEDLYNCFEDSERPTSAQIYLIKLQKPGANYSQEFEGFFMGEDATEQQENGIMPYNFIRDLVNRYVESIKIYDAQLTEGVRMNRLLSGFYGGSIAFHCTESDKPVMRSNFKKAMQKAGWKFIFAKMNMEKYATKGLKEDINKFVEQQTEVPFTMRNIYKMLEIIIGTQEQRMDKAILEVFDKVTQHHSDNRHNVEGWKTNSHFVLGKRFIMPHIVEANYSGGMRETYYGWAEPIEDLQKALCYLMGEDYDKIPSLRKFLNDTETEESKVLASYKKQYENRKFGEWHNWHFFKIRGYKKGTMHFEFKNEDVWGRFNQRVAKLKGYPLFEYKKQTAYQDRNTGRTAPKAAASKPAKEAEILFTF
jgi:predicted RNA methylase